MKHRFQKKRLKNIPDSSISKPESSSPYNGDLAKSLEGIRSQSRGWIESHLDEFTGLSASEKIKAFHSLIFQGAGMVRQQEIFILPNFTTLV